jgi:periplasmic divalent cation tolerance protein
MPHSYCLITTTAGSQDEAEHLANLLVRERLAACVQISRIFRVYTWEETLHKDEEWLLLIKTRADLYEQVEGALHAHHSYEIPEIICVPITQGAAPYLAWIDENTKG